MKSWLKKWVLLLPLVLVPVAQAEGTAAMDSATQATVETAKSSTPSAEVPQAKQVEELQREVAALKAEVAADQSRSDVGEYASDVDSHPLWP